MWYVPFPRGDCAPDSARGSVRAIPQYGLKGLGVRNVPTFPGLENTLHMTGQRPVVFNSSIRTVMKTMCFESDFLSLLLTGRIITLCT